MTVAGQVLIDFDYDERTARLAKEVEIILLPRLMPGTPRDDSRELSERIAKLAERRYKDAWEPKEPIRCHTCDEMTLPAGRVRVVVCARCSVEGRSVGSSG